MDKCMKLHVWSMGLALGVVWGLGMFILGLMAMCGWGETMVTTMASVYIGFAATWLGSVIGALWGFVDAFIFGVILAWLYNCFMGCSCWSKKSDE